MSFAKNYDDAQRFLAGSEERASLLSRLIGELGLYWAGLRDGLAAARLYRDMTGRGVPHETAVEKAFDRHLR